MIVDALKSLAVPIDQLKLDPKNARLHNDKNLEAIKNSLSMFGQRKPIVALEDGTVIAGNGTLTAARALGWQAIAVVRVKDDAATAAAYALADNRTAELAEWDLEALKETVDYLSSEGVDLDALAFGDDDMAELLAELDAVDDYRNEIVNDPEVPYTRELEPSSNYMLVLFDKDEDFQQAVERFGLSRAKACLSKSGNPAYMRYGVGRIVNFEQVRARMRDD